MNKHPEYLDIGMATCYNLAKPFTRRCFICREFTTFIEVNFEAPLCSDQCVEAMWKEYFDVLHSV